MGRLTSIALGIEQSLHSRFGKWVLETSAAVDALEADNASRVVVDRGSIDSQTLRWNGSKWEATTRLAVEATGAVRVNGVTDTEQLIVNTPAGALTDIQTWRRGGVVVADITATGAIEANAISFQNGLATPGGGGVVGELAGGALTIYAGPQSNGNIVLGPTATGTLYVAPGQNTSVANAIQLGVIAGGGGVQGIQLPNGQSLFGCDNTNIGPFPVLKIAVDNSVANGTMGGGYTWRTKNFGAILVQLFETGQLFLANSAVAGTLAGGGYFYVTAGALHWKGSGGTDTPLAPA